MGRGMRPVFEIKANDDDITSILKDRFLSLRITDEVGIVADQFELNLDDRDGQCALPDTGVSLSVALGYQEQTLHQMGSYSVDEIELSGITQSMLIRGKAANMKASLKSWRKESYHQTTLGKILESIAKRHDLRLITSSAFKDIAIAHIDQTYESDLHLITRLAEQYDAIAKPAAGFLLFTQRGESLMADGKKLPTIHIQPNHILQWNFCQRDRYFYASVGAHFKDKRSAKISYVYAGSGEPVMYLRHPYKSQQDAHSAALAKLKQLQRGRYSMSLSVLGNPIFCAEMPVLINGIKSGVDGDWLVSRVEHTLDNSGFITQLELQKREDFLKGSDESEEVV